MADPIPSRPLWELMQAAYFKGRNPGISEPHGYAAELRAIAREIAKRDPDNTMSALAVEEWLTKEADRAEAGQ